MWQARLDGTPFTRMASIAHQQLFLHPGELTDLRAAYRAHPAPPVAEPLAGYQFGEYLDRFCREYLGVAQLDTIDYSDYEGATIVHDLNTPLPARHQAQFDAVLEAGSLEHIFNFPVAMANVMKLVKPGGMLFLSTPANNLCGHGFYQFSPELFYRVLSPENGFARPACYFLEAASPWVELTPYRRVFAVTDPKDVRQRVGLLSQRPVMMLLVARKIEHVEPFATPPLQSDYTVAWEQSATPTSAAAPASWRGRLLQKLPDGLRNRILGARSAREYSFGNSAFYRQLP